MEKERADSWSKIETKNNNAIGTNKKNM